MLAVLATLVLVPRASADDEVMMPALVCCSMLTETLDGVVTGTLPLPTFPYDAEVAHDGSVVFRGGDGTGLEGIWVARPGQDAVRVTSNVYDGTPTITYDGRRIAFTRVVTGVGTGDLYIANSDGTGLTELLSGGQTQQYRDPEFSPDGRFLSVICTPANPSVHFVKGCGPAMDGSYTQWGMILINLDGSGKRLINETGPAEYTWFPDAQHIAFEGGGREGVTEIFSYRTDGSDLFSGGHQITHELAPVFMPSVSPDSSRVVFLETQNPDGSGCGGCNLLANVDGDGTAQLLHLQGFPYPVFIPPAAGGAMPPAIDATHVYVPPLRGLSVPTAKRRLHRAHLTVGAVMKRYSRVARGHVIRVRPRAGTRMHRRSQSGPSVTLFVSRGRRH